MTELVVDDSGWPVLLDTAPAAADSTAEVQAPGGLPAPPSGVDPGEWDRRADAVRDAAREFENFGAQDAKEWVKGRTQRELGPVELGQFVMDVRQQVIADLSDILDQTEQGKLRSRRTVRVVAPRGYVRKTIKSLTPEETSALRTRLLARGWTVKQLDARLPVVSAEDQSGSPSS
jgi:hypothetical protein